MGASGTATLDFGAFPGGSDASVVITGQLGIVASSVCEAWILPNVSADHSSDEHVVEPIDICTSDIVFDNVGFTIRGVSRSPGDSRIYGQWNVAWAWL